jgi:sacsin
MPTNLPVHIHGLFCMAPDRGRLEPTRGPDDPHTKWNRFMFSSCIALAWIKLLAHRSSVSWNKEMFAFWPRPNFVPVETVQLWDQLDDNVIDLAIKSNHKVWNASNGRCVSLDQGFFGVKGGDYTEFGPALAQVDVPAVYLEDPLFRKLQQRAKLLGKGYKLLEPSTVRCFLRSRTIPNIPEVQASVILEFCLLDAIKSVTNEKINSTVYEELQDIALWPTVGGAFSISKNKDLLLPRNEVEMQLFAKSRAANTLEISKLSNPVRHLLLRDVENIGKVMRFRSLDDLIIDWPVIYEIPQGLSRSSMGSIQRPSGSDALIWNLWAWIVERFQEGQRLSPASSQVLWLIPTNDGRIRSCTPSFESLPVLIIEQKKDPLYDVIMRATTRTPKQAPPVLCSSILPTEAVELFRSNEPLRMTTRCTCVSDTNDFVAWLVAGRDMLSATSDGDKEALLNHLESSTRYLALQEGLPPKLRTPLRHLPLYSKRSCSPPFKTIGYAKCSLDARGQMYKTPPGLPPLPNLSKVSFFEAQSEVERLFIERLKALPRVSDKDLLTQHFLPWMGTVTSDDAALSLAKEELVHWIMKMAPTHPCSAEWQVDVFSHAIIPLPVEGGQRRYRCIAGMVDPSSSLAPLYDAGENVFPCPHFYTKHKNVLIAYGLTSKMQWDTPLERARYFAHHGDEVDINTKVETLLKLRVLSKLSSSKDSIAEIRRLKWIPCTSVLGESILHAPFECRGADDRHLIDLVWGITTLSMEPSWKRVLGWDEGIPTGLLLQQLDGCLSKQVYEKAHQVLLEIDLANSSDLLSRCCILGRSGAHFTPKKVFLSGSSLARRPLAPYLDEVDNNFARQHGALLAALHVRSEPSIEDLQDVQRALASASEGQLSPPDLRIAISTLEIADLLKYDLTGFLIPDTTSKLQKLIDIVHSDSPDAGMKEDLIFTHPGISPELANRLGLEDTLARAIRLQIALDSDNEEDYVPGEKLTTVISDTLGRYSIASTFNEFLANADDAKATKIVWTLDECNDGAHASTALLTTDLKPLQGAALFAYNNGGKRFCLSIPQRLH